MAEWLDRYGSAESAYKALTGQQHYFLEVKGPAYGVALSVISFEAVEKIGEPYRITIEITHPDVLTRGDYLGREAVFTMDPLDLTEPRKFSGCITRFSQIKTTRDLTAYRVVVEPYIARLKLTRSSRIYQNRTAPQIIEAVLRRHDLRGHQFLFKLRRKYPEHKFRFQYQVDDWTYIQILMQQEGIYCYIVPGEFGDIVVFGDDIDHYIYKPILTVPYREASALVPPKAAVYGAPRAEWVSALQTHMETVPASFLVADYNPEKAFERYKAEANVARKDTTTYGQPYVYGTHHMDRLGAEWEAQLRHEAAIAWQVVYEGESNVFDLRPARVLRMDVALPDAPNGQMIIEITHSGARDKDYRNTYKAIPSDRRFRLKIEDEKWPKIMGTLSGRVTSLGNYKFAYLNEQGHYRVRFDLDFADWTPGLESVPLRLAKPFAGGKRTGFHFPVADGTEAVLEFRDGDPNKPYISQFHHDSQHPDLITSVDPQLKTWGNVAWRRARPSRPGFWNVPPVPLHDELNKAAVGDSGMGSQIVEVPTDGGPSRGAGPLNGWPSRNEFVLQDADENGDGTVPRRSGAGPSQHAKVCVPYAGVDHEGAYKNEPQRRFALWAIIKIAFSVRHTSMAYKDFK